MAAPAAGVGYTGSTTVWEGCEVLLPLALWALLACGLMWLVTRTRQVRRPVAPGEAAADVFAQARDVLADSIAGVDPELPLRVGQRQALLSIRQQADTQAAAAAIVQGHRALHAIPAYLRATPDEDGVAPTARYATIVQAALSVLKEAEAASHEAETATLRALEAYARTQWSDGLLDLDDDPGAEPLTVRERGASPSAEVVVTDYRHPDLMAAVRELGSTGRSRDAGQLKLWLGATSRAEQERYAPLAAEVVTACRQQHLSWGDGRVQEAMFRLREAAQAAIEAERTATARVSLPAYVPDWLGEVILTLDRIGDRDIALELSKSRAWLTQEQQVALGHDAQRLDRICREPAKYPPHSRRTETDALVARVERMREQTRKARRSAG